MVNWRFHISGTIHCRTAWGDTKRFPRPEAQIPEVVNHSPPHPHHQPTNGFFCLSFTPTRSSGRPTSVLRFFALCRRFETPVLPNLVPPSSLIVPVWFPFYPPLPLVPNVNSSARQNPLHCVSAETCLPPALVCPHLVYKHMSNITQTLPDMSSLLTSHIWTLGLLCYCLDN